MSKPADRPHTYNILKTNYLKTISEFLFFNLRPKRYKTILNDIK